MYSKNANSSLWGANPSKMNSYRWVIKFELLCYSYSWVIVIVYSYRWVIRCTRQMILYCISEPVIWMSRILIPGLPDWRVNSKSLSISGCRIVRICIGELLIRDVLLFNSTHRLIQHVRCRCTSIDEWRHRISSL